MWECGSICRGNRFAGKPSRGHSFLTAATWPKRAFFVQLLDTSRAELQHILEEDVPLGCQLAPVTDRLADPGRSSPERPRDLGAGESDLRREVGDQRACERKLAQLRCAHDLGRMKSLEGADRLDQ